MMIDMRVLRHSWVTCVLLAACGMGGQKSSTMATSPHSAPASAAYEPAAPSPYYDSGAIAEETVERPGLGTSWGEHVTAPVTYRPFQRASADPWAEVALHYNDADGVRAHAAFVGSGGTPLEVPAGDGSLSVALVDEYGNTLPGFFAGGRALVIGNDGARYRIIVRNATTARFEVVASVDGLDVVDGRPADPQRRGYIVDPHDTLVIDGFRTSDDGVAAFRFGRVAESYAAQTSGDRNVGVIGLAIFSERGAVWSRAELHRRDSANPFPQRSYAMPPR